MHISKMVKELDDAITTMEKTFEDKQWDFYKFGKGGPFNHLLLKFQRLTHKCDFPMREYFKLERDTASFVRLITVSLMYDKKERWKAMHRLKRQVADMKEKANV